MSATTDIITGALKAAASSATPIGAIANAVGDGVKITEEILNRSDRDKPTNTLNEDITEVQNGFANNDLDAQYRVMYRLFNSLGHAPTPGGDVGTNERQFRHDALIIAAECIYWKTIANRAVEAVVKK